MFRPATYNRIAATLLLLGVATLQHLQYEVELGHLPVPLMDCGVKSDLILLDLSDEIGLLGAELSLKDSAEAPVTSAVHLNLTSMVDALHPFDPVNSPLAYRSLLSSHPLPERGPPALA
jgi:hypothetical protein